MLPSIFQERLQSRLVRFGYVCLLAALAWTLFWPAPSRAGLSLRQVPQTQNQIWSSSTDADEQIFVVYRNERGEFACRDATKTERERISGRRRGGSTQLIYDGAAKQRSKSGTQKSTSVPTPDLALQPSAGLRIVLHGTTQLKQNPQAEAAFIIAANRWEAIIATPITVVLDVDFGTTFFGQPYPNPGILGATGTASNTGTFSDLRQRLINGASNAGESQLYNALPATTVPIELNNGVTSFSNAEVTRANARALGIVPDITNPESLSLGQADAGIGFNSAFPFDFNPDDGITSGLTDFDSVATHEIGHALGFVSDAGSDDSLVTVWDLFRFRPGLASLETFATAPRVMSTGGSQVFFSNEVTTYGTFELGLSTGGPDGEAGDGRQSSHWRDDRLDPPRQYIGIMDPTLVDGARKTLSENDMKAIDLFGYSIGGPPIVRPPNDNFANAILLSTASGSVNASNVNATREFGEPLHVGLLGDKSIWYTWQSSVNGQATFDTIGSNFDTTLAVYTGSALFQLSTVAQNDDIQNGVNRVSRVQFNITAGTTYRIAVDGWNSEFGNVTLNWTSSGVVPTPTPTPTPSDFALESFVATPNPVGITQYVNFKVSARALNGPALNPTISVVLPFGVTFVGCEPFCVAPGTSDGGTVNANFGDLSPDTLVILVVTARVTAPIGSILPSTATLITSNPDAVPGNNSALTTFTVRDVIPFLEVKKLSVSAIGRHVLALRGGTVWSWGTNFDGELGDGTNINRSFPAQIDDLMFVKDVGAGSGYSVALKNDGTVWTWGLDGLGQLGNGTTNGFSRNRPSQVMGLSGVTAIAAGTFHVLALKSDGTVWAWGSNGRGELGIGLQDFIAHPTPVQIPGLSNILSIYAEDGLSYAFKSNGEVWGWGSGFGGKMGDGTTGSIKPSPTELPLLKDTPTLVSALNATFAIKQDGAVWSFGYNAAGRLGRGILDTAIYPVPTQIPDLLARAVSAGETHTIVVEPGGTIKVFGGNESGQLGLGSADFSAHPSPISVPGVSAVFATASGGGASFVLVGDSATGGTIQAWGANVFGVLGLGTTFPISTPTVVEENLTVARPIFSIPPGTVSATQVHIACGTPGAVIHYTTNGSDPTESDPVIASGSPVTVDHSLTLKARAFRSSFATSAIKSATYTVVVMPPIQLLLDESGPSLDQVAALDSLLFLRDPFPVVNLGDLLNQGADRNTRVIVFTKDLLLAQGAPASSVLVNLIDSNNQIFDVAAEEVRSLPATEFVQVTFRLPNTLAVGTCTIRIKLLDRVSNAGTLRIKG